MKESGRNEKDLWRDISSDIEKFYIEVINKVLPNAESGGASVVGSPDEKPTIFESNLARKESLFKGSPYEYKGDNDFIHFTNLSSLSSILTSGFLRMSEFGHLSDENELIYGAKIFTNNSAFKFNEEKISSFKQNLFCLSMTQFSQETVIDPFLWETYSSKSNGVCIRFKLRDKAPYGFVLGQVLYGEDNLEHLIKLRDLAINYKANAPMFPDDFSELITELYAFHKSKKYYSEREVRLIFRNDKGKYQKHNHTTIYTDVTSNNTVKYFNKAYLKGRNQVLQEFSNTQLTEDEIMRYFLELEITDIYIGSNLSIINKIELLDWLNELKTKHNYCFNVYHLDTENNIRRFN